MFQIKDFTSITAAMINHMRATQERVTDFHVGSVARTLIEAPAIELDEFYQRVLHGLLEAIPIAVYRAFDFAALPAATAAGKVRITMQTRVVDPVKIPAGTIFLRSDTRMRYLSTAEAYIPAEGDFIDVPIRAEWPGFEGNAPVGVIAEMVGFIANIATIANIDPVVGGKDEESPEERKARFVDYIGSLSRGTEWAVVYAVKRAQVLNKDRIPVEYVTRVGVREEAGHVDIYIYGSGGTPTSALLETAQSTIDGGYDPAQQKWYPGYRAVGVQITVRPMTQKNVDVVLQVKMLSGVTGTEKTINAIRDALSARFFAIHPHGVLHVEEIIEAALSVPGVERVLCRNDANIICESHQVLALRKLSVEWWDGA